MVNKNLKKKIVWYCFIPYHAFRTGIGNSSRICDPNWSDIENNLTILDIGHNHVPQDQWPDCKREDIHLSPIPVKVYVGQDARFICQLQHFDWIEQPYRAVDTIFDIFLQIS